MSYSSPTPATVILNTGLRPELLGKTIADFEVYLQSLIDAAEAQFGLARLAALITDDASLIAARGIENYVAADAYRDLAGTVAGGVNPANMVHMPAEILAVSREFRSVGDQLLTAASQTLVDTTMQPAAFALPYASASTFLPGVLARSPAARNELLDDSDDISPFDLVHG